MVGRQPETPCNLLIIMIYSCMMVVRAAGKYRASVCVCVCECVRQGECYNSPVFQSLDQVGSISSIQRRMLLW